MSNRKLVKAVQSLFRQIWKLSRSLSKGLITWLLRTLLVTRRRQGLANAGFVLPTTVLLLLVVSLTVGTITYRAFNRTSQAIGQRQQAIVYNAATPVMDRAKAKIEYLLRKDERRPGGVPSDFVLDALMKNNGSGGFPVLTNNPYRLPDETQVDVNGDNQLDAAWSYQIDSARGPQTVVYSVVMRDNFDANNDGDTEDSNDVNLRKSTEAEKARVLVTRNGPLNLGGTSANPLCSSSARNPEGGWYPTATDTSRILKTFQVDAVVVGSGSNRTITTLELQQDRQVDRGNKWGAWFRNDLEIFPGPSFNWNGAMHTRGSMIIGDSSDRFRGFMISSPGSCVYRKDASEVTITEDEVSPNSPGGTYTGQMVAGSTKLNTFTGSSRFDIFSGVGATPITNAPSISRNNDSIGTEPGGGVAAIALDPIEIVTTDASKTRATGWTRDTTWLNTDHVRGERTYNETSPIPYLDDIYRADNRWGPKPVYNTNFRQVADGTKVIGEEIDPATAAALVNDVAPPGAAENLGLDGYWERRARVEGLRLIVGQRLELGNPFGWVTPVDANGDGDTLDNPSNNGALGRDLPPLPPRKATVTTAAASPTDITRIPFLPEMWGDPLYPPDRTSASAAERQHEARQRRALRDNLAAVQSTAVYQWDFNNDYPLACVATTVHPGTQTTLDRSTNFVPTTFAERDTASRISLISNFFLGRGTNGWEFEPPATNVTNFGTAITTANSPLRKGLRNLSRFAGDPRGGFPAVQEPLPVASGGTGRNIIHPYPRTTMWGDYSELRRVVDKLDGINPDGTTRTPIPYASLSPADKTTLHTAACTLGMLAYNVRTVEQFQSSNPENQTVGTSTNVMSSLAQKLAVMTDGDPTNGEIGPTPTTYTSVLEREYTQVRYSSYPPEAYIERLKQAPFNATDAEVRLAEMIYLSHQVNRDRLFGFRGSPVTWYEYNFDPTNAVSGTQVVQVPLACNPDEFSSAGGSPTLTGSGANPIQRRLALARLCGHVRFKQALTPSMVARSETDLSPSGSDSATNRPFRYDGIDVGPRFPSLYYIFPRFTHDHDGKVEDLTNGSNNTADTQYQAPGMQPGLLTQDEAETPDGTATAVPWINDIDHRQPGNTNAADRLGTSAVFRAPELRPVTTGQYDPRLLSPQGDAPNQPTSNATVDLPPEPYVVDPNIRGTGGASDTTAVVPSTFNYEKFTINDLETVWVRPRPLGGGLAASTNVASTGWTLPATVASNSPCRPTAANPNVLIRPDGSCYAVALQDKALFNGREIMNARVLDLDLDMMRRSVPTGSNDTLIPTGTTSPGSTEDSTSGIIYAFREDAIREDRISRPAINRGTALDGAMNAVRGPSAPPWTPNATTVSYPVDPTLNTNGISKKPVDYYPDPDRRPFGFRLRKGVDIRRAPGGTVNTNNLAGMSFISDAPVYIQGNFNHHSTDGTANPGSRLEEFTQLLADDWSNFYNRTANQIDNRFASTQDAWRPAEILSDGITILSDNFVDGTIEEGFLNTGSSSYRNQRGPTSQPRWLREIPWRSNVALTDANPIVVSRNGNPLYCEDTLPATTIFTPFSCRRPREFGIDTGTGAVLTSAYSTSGTAPTATETRINSIIVSGIVPSQALQSYGGFHNFPRFIQNWGGQNLYISGSFLQLNFSNYATGPFDHDALEPGLSPTSTESIPYYGPPSRRWGYDVGLQYAPAGPVARRFVTIGSNWSEYYKELPVDDPYIANLRCAKNGGTRVINDTTITCP